MMKKLIMAGIAMLTIAISSCDEDTTTLGSSLTHTVDQFIIATDTFNVSTRSIIADSVLARSAYSYLGCIKDPETGAYITSDFTTQFNLLENEADDFVAPRDSIVSRDEAGEIIADSCSITIIVNRYQGDSLAAMKLRVTELDTPIKEDRQYYSNFDPAAANYLRTDGLTQNKVYSLTDLTQSDSVRNIHSVIYYDYINIPLTQPYTDHEGNHYNNYGTYLLRNYFAHPEYYRNSHEFTQHVCPGFYFQSTDGLGVLSEISGTMMSVHYQVRRDTTTYTATNYFQGTEEVLQTTRITNDKASISRLAAEDTCTYLKTPAGIFTEVILPVDEIKFGHENDTITSAKIVFRSMNKKSDLSDVILEEPQNLLMIERDSLYAFFEHRNLPNNTTSYLATYSSLYRTYTFENISSLVNHMYTNRGRSENWNRVVLVPVETTTTSSSSSYYSTTTITNVNNTMSLSSVRLVGGANNRHEPVRISVIYNE